MKRYKAKIGIDIKKGYAYEYFKDENKAKEWVEEEIAFYEKFTGKKYSSEIEEVELKDNCYYCEKKAINIVVTNDWGNIPLCNKKECLKKFKGENKSQYFIKSV